MIRRSCGRAVGALQPLCHELPESAQRAALQTARQLAHPQQHTQQHARQGALLRGWRRWMSQEAAGAGGGGGGGGGGAPKGSPKSMLDSGFAHPGGTGQVLGSTAEMRMQQLQQEAAAAAAAAQAGAPAAAGAAAGPAAAEGAAAAPGALARARRLVGDLLFYGGLAAAAGAGYVYSKYESKEVEHWLADARARAEAPGPAALAWAGAAWAIDHYLSAAHFVDHKVREYTDPPCDRLLPDMDPQWAGRVKTLVLDLEDVLVHREWSRAKGWQIYRRPGARDFLGQLGQYYEVVVYTDEQPLYADPIINALDTGRAVQYRLYRQDTQYVDGKHVRDLSKLNRPLGHVLFISAKPDAYSFQPENTLKLKPWHPEKPGDPKDTTLLDLIPFLQMVAERVPDVRDVVKAYDGEDDVAKAFKERMSHIAHQAPRRKGLIGAAPAAAAAR